jgi:hypothetical protein
MYTIAAQRTKANATKQPFVAGFVGFHGEKYVVANEFVPPAALAYVDAELDMQKLEIVEMQKLLKYVEMRQKKTEDYRKMC